MRKFLIFFMAGFVSFPSHAFMSVICKTAKQQRKVEIRYLEEGKKLPCQVVYTLETGEEKILYSAQNQLGYCKEKATEFAGGLVERGFVCSQEEMQSDQGAPTDAQSSSPPQVKSAGESNTLGPVQGPTPSR